MYDFDYIVVGSGPSSTGFYLSESFQNNIKKFCIIDTHVDYRNSHDKKSSSKELFRLHDIKNKTYYGSSLATKSKLPFELETNINISNSYFKGGLSNVWGGANERYNVGERQEMGLDFDDIYYDKIEKHLNIANFEIPTNSKLNGIYHKLKKNSSKSLYTTASKLSIDMTKCIKCRECLYGCPTKAIYNSKYNFSHITKDVSLYTNAFVNKIYYDSPNNIRVEVVSLNDGSRKTYKTKNIILGCGPINTSKLLLKSFKEFSSIQINDSQGITIPLFDFTFSKFFNIEDDNYIELSNFYIKTLIDGKKFHGQFYFSGEYIRNQVSKQFKIPKPFLSNLLNLVYIYQGYLSSNYSSSGLLSIKEKKFNFTEIKKYDKKMLNELINKNGTYFKKAGLQQLNFLKKIAPILSTYHFGNINIKLKNSEIIPSSTDGSLKGYDGIHLIDASILQSLPGGPITSTVMANAMKIANDIIN